MQQLPPLPNTLLSRLRQGGNLLAFSAGVDSSALFFTLLAYEIPFEVAHVNYQTRKESDKEEAHVKRVCGAHNIPCHTTRCLLPLANFEHHARTARYVFFESILQAQGLDTLLMAHQLNDRLEWLLMRLCQGAGAVELAGFQQEEARETYCILRPFNTFTKESLLAFLHVNHLPFFQDDSNQDPRFLRNHFRANISNPLLATHEAGIRQSLEFLSQDAALLQGRFDVHIHKLFVANRHGTPSIMRLVDKAAKHLGVVMSQGQRQTICERDGVVGGKVAVGWSDTHVFIAPFLQITMPKPFKEACRHCRIPALVRPYMYKQGIDPKALVQTL